MRRLDACYASIGPSFDVRMPQSGQRSGECAAFCIISSWSANIMHPLLIASKHEDRRRKASQSPAAERRLRALEHQRAKLVAMLAMCRMSPARRARLRAKLANVDEMIRLVNRIGLH